MKWVCVFIFVTLMLAGCARNAPPKTSAEIGGKAVTYIFVGVDCPISNSYAPELNRIISEYSMRDIAFYLVYPDTSITAQQAAEHAREFNFRCPMLLDTDHAIAKRFGATVTIEAVVVSLDGTLQYRGRIDDLYVSLGQKRFAATTHDLRDALDAIVDNRPVKPTTTLAIGCPIN